MAADLEAKLRQLNLVETSAISIGKLDPDYVLDFAVQNSDGMMAATSSNYTTRLYSSADLANVGSVKGHTDVVTGVTFGKTEGNLLYSSSYDKTVRCWDLRLGLDKEVQVFKGPDTVQNCLTCLDVDCTDRLICAGTEEKSENAYILFWDKRKVGILGCYQECHQGDITQVCFHPSNKDCMASASEDGLVCTFDISQTTEDDALLYTFNAECCVNCIGWYGPNKTSVYCLTSIDTFHVWDTIEGDEIDRLSDIKDKLNGASSIDYIVDVIIDDHNGRDVFVAGTYGGNIQVIEVVGNEVNILKTLKGGHKDRVRCCNWNRETASLITGGEDSLLCLWSALSSNTSSVSKSKVKTKKKDRKSQPY